MSAEVWGVIAAFAGVGAAFMAVFVAAFFYLLSAIQRLGLEIRTELREERNSRQAELQEERRQRAEERNARLAEIQEERRVREVQIQEERRVREAERQEERRVREAERQEERRVREAEVQRLFDSLSRHRHDESDSMYVPAADDD